MSTVSEWLATRKPAAPEALQQHMAKLLASHADVGAEANRVAGAAPGAGDSESLADPLIAACNTAFTRVLDSGAASRDSALDLLSADAFVTYAFEAAADAPETISERSTAAMQQISDLARPRLATENR